MEIISAPTDLSAPLHYFPHMLTMTKSLSPPGLEQLDNDVDIGSSPTTSYSCPILSSISPDRLNMFPTAAETPGTTTVLIETTPSPSKSCSSLTLTGHNGGLPPLDLSTSPEKPQSPGHGEVTAQDQIADVTQVATDTKGHAPVTREGWIQMLQQMPSLYNNSTSHGSGNLTSLVNSMLNSSNTDSLHEDSESVNSGLPSDAVNTSSSTTSDCNDTSLPASHQIDSFMRFQSMLNDMNKLMSNQNQPSDTDNALVTGTNFLSNLPESLKSMFLFMSGSSDHNINPAPVQSATTLLPEGPHLLKNNPFSKAQPRISDHFSGASTSFPTQNSVLPPEGNLMTPKPDRPPYMSAPVDLTASFLAMLAASHKATSSGAAQRNKLACNNNATTSHPGHMMSAPIFSPSAPMSSGMTTNVNAPAYTVPCIPPNLSSFDPLANMSTSMFDLNSNRQSAPDPITFPPVLPHQLSENRELLYQLGQRLMAMATLSDFMNSVSCPPPSRANTDITGQYSHSSTALNATSPNTFSSNPLEAAVAAAAAAMLSQYGAPFLPGYPKATTGAIHPKHTGAAPAGYNTSTAVAVASPLSSPQGLPSRSSASPTLSASISSTGPTGVSKFGVDKSPMPQKPQHASVNPGTTPTGLSGVSMRGNQKYSAYYQNQRKQGFSGTSAGASGNITGDYFYCNRSPSALSPASGSRRSGLPANNPVLNSRYVNRRFRGNISGLPALSSHAMDSKSGNQRMTVGRNTSVGASGVTYPGYRQSGIGFKPLSTTSSLFSPGGNKRSVTLPKYHESTEPSASSGQPNHSGTNEAVGPISSRHKDTAFLCSCGKDFENLYVFIIHMKDTGHKPKSDHCDKDIPKLVRGQDMWINSETEQTREILRCMRCHQSFRSLPELTLHMMQTNHYSEIVYNDSGRLVFVNPDEHRRGPSASTVNNPSLSSPGKVSPGATASTLSTRRGWKTLSYTPTTSVGSFGSFWSNGSQTSVPSDHGENTRHHSDRHEVKNSNQCTPRSEPEKLYNNTDNNFGSCTLPVQSTDQVPETTKYQSCDNEGLTGSVSMNTKTPNLSSELPEGGSIRGCQKSPMSMKSDSSVDNHNNQATGCREINVLKQIETFVENSLPSGSKCLSVKTDNSTSSTSSSFTSAPLSALTPTSEGAHGCWNSLQTTQQCSEASTSSSLPDSRVDRKRRHSEANSVTGASCHNSPSGSSINEQHDAKIRVTDCELNLRATQPLTTNNSETGSPVLQSATPSPSKVTSTTGDSDFSTKRKPKPHQLRNPMESPLSSLQKLVDTTAHKPIAPSVAFSEPHTPHSHLPLSATLTVTRSNTLSTRPHSRTISSQHQPTRPTVSMPESGVSKNIVNTTSSNSITSQSIISSAEESEMPALSALYAYVERSSPCQSQESIQNTKGSVSPDDSEANKLDFTHSRSINSPQSYLPISSSKPPTPSLASSSPLETMSMANQLTPPILQQAAFCAAILSNLTAAPRPVSSQAQPAQLKGTPLRDASAPLPNMPEMLYPVRESTNNTDRDELSDMAGNWWRMLQNLFATCGGSQFPIMPSMAELENNQMRDSEKGNTKSMVTDPNILREGGLNNRNQFIPVSSRGGPPCSIPVNISSVNTCKNSNSSTSVPSPLMTSLANYRTPLPVTTFSHRFNSNLTNQPLGAGMGPSAGGGLMSSIITKKAKCHFCGKPFANKGQVRLHISKNKCPCLLQQSCHVAALAAAFGGDTRRGEKHSFLNSSPHNSAMSKSSLFNQFSPSSGNQKSSQPHLLHPGMPSCSPDDSTGTPSALTLLKERFQNFDLSLASPQHNQPNQSTQQASTFHNATSTSALTSQSAPLAAGAGVGALLPVNMSSSECDLPNMTSWLPPGFPTLQNVNHSSPNPAANANHLAAMALLAQTLVQLTSASATQGTSDYSNSRLPAPQQSLYQQPDNVADAARPQESLDTLMPFLADANGLDRETLLNSAKWLTQLTNPASRVGPAKQRTDQSGQATCAPRGGDSDGACDVQLSDPRPKPATTTSNGHL